MTVCDNYNPPLPPPPHTRIGLSLSLACQPTSEDINQHNSICSKLKGEPKQWAAMRAGTTHWPISLSTTGARGVVHTPRKKNQRPTIIIIEWDPDSHVAKKNANFHRIIQNDCVFSMCEFKPLFQSVKTTVKRREIKLLNLSHSSLLKARSVRKNTGRFAIVLYCSVKISALFNRSCVWILF